MLAKSGQVTVSAIQAAEVDLTPAGAYQWLVYQIALSASGSSVVTASVFLNQRFICGTNIGNQDAADGSPVPVRNGDTLRIVWTGCPVGTVCNAQLLVEESVAGQQLSGG